MARLTENARRHVGESLTIRWGTSRGRDTYGYTTCSLRNHRGKRIAACNAGGYDMAGTVIGEWVALTFAKELRRLKFSPDCQGKPEFHGLSYHDPHYDPGQALTGTDCADRTLGKGAKSKTVAQAEADGESLGLERYQAFYAASSPTPTKRHTVPLIHGACGLSSVLTILRAIGLSLKKVVGTCKLDVYVIEKAKPLT